jgi:TPR repeat protein
MYVLGEGVPRNKIEAFKWLTIADRSGRPEARKVLANIRKTMTPEDVEEAQKRIRQHYTGGR